MSILTVEKRDLKFNIGNNIGKLLRRGGSILINWPRNDKNKNYTENPPIFPGSLETDFETLEKTIHNLVTPQRKKLLGVPISENFPSGNKIDFARKRKTIP